MYEQFALIFDTRIPTLTVALMLVTLLSFAWMVWQSPPQMRGRVFDVCLGAVLGGIVLGRVMHVAINWEFFSERLPLIWQLSREGGINWQAFIVGVLLCGRVIARWRGIALADMLKTASILVPLIAFVSWYGCATAGCAYGETVDRMSAFPAWMTWIAPDMYRLEMPRFATQAIGMALSLVVLLIALVLHLGDYLPKTRFWWLLSAIAVLSLGIGFLRGDATVQVIGLRIGQILDVIVIAVCVVAIGLIAKNNARA